ncbi:MAG TPA: hypothetical protein VH186_09640 [Chloroflexia bacterium]|nr:hypothetical protein [Chloroflexia bacterium]
MPDSLLKRIKRASDMTSPAKPKAKEGDKSTPASRQPGASRPSDSQKKQASKPGAGKRGPGERTLELLRAASLEDVLALYYPALFHTARLRLIQIDQAQASLNKKMALLDSRIHEFEEIVEISRAEAEEGLYQNGQVSEAAAIAGPHPPPSNRPSPEPELPHAGESMEDLNYQDKQ